MYLGHSARQLPRIAFFTVLQDDLGPIPQAGNLLFDKMLLNRGNAFDMRTVRTEIIFILQYIAHISNTMI